MELWLWVVNGVLWLAATGLTGMGIRKLLSGIHLLDVAKLAFARSEAERIHDSASELLKDVQNDLQAANEVTRRSLEFDTKLREMKEQVRKVQELEEASTELLNKVNALGEAKFPLKGAEIVATKDIALAAAFFAMASVLVGVSAVLIVVF